MAFPPHSFMFQQPQEDNDHHLTSPPSCPPLQFFHGASFLMKRSMSFSGVNDMNKCSTEDQHHLNHHQLVGDDQELSDDGSQLGGEKKKRLNLEQVKALEKSFELANKLEPERKMQLARALGLQPRQIAIWFQNRRARWKTKQLEKDYQLLKKQFDALKSDNDALQAQNNKLHAEVMVMSLKNNRDSSNKDHRVQMIHDLKKENEGSWSNGSDNSTSDINLDLSTTPITTTPASPPHSTSKHLFHSSILRPAAAAGTNMTQFLQGSSRPDHLQMVQVQDHEPFCNMFTPIEEQQATTAAFWQWPDHPNFQ